MPPPFGSSTVDTRDRGAPADGDGVRRPTLDYSSSEDSVVWGAAAPLSPTALSATERRFKFRGLPQAVGAARRVLRRWEDHFEPDLFYDLSLCVSELVTNAVQRGEPEGGDEIELVVRRGKELVRVEVREPQPDVVITKSPAGAPSCWGMFIVDRVADRWGVDRGEGTVVWCEIDLASDGWSRRTPPLGRTLST